MTGLLYAVRCEGPPQTMALLVDLLAATEGIQAATWFDPDADRAQLSVYAEDERTARVLWQRLAANVDAWRELLPGAVEILDIASLPQENWAESWKKHFHARRVSPRIVVKPTWETWDQGTDDLVLEIDPGMSFGTGQHATTAACLQFLDRLANLAPGVPMADVGCGSGILAIAAVKLGFAPVFAFDMDPLAVTAARENAAANHVADAVDVQERVLTGWRPACPFPVIVANVFANILRHAADDLVAALPVAPPAYLVLSGILDRQFDEVRDTFEARGLVLDDRLQIEEWTTGLFRRAPA